MPCSFEKYEKFEKLRYKSNKFPRATIVRGNVTLLDLISSRLAHTLCVQVWMKCDMIAVSFVAHNYTHALGNKQA